MKSNSESGHYKIVVNFKTLKVFVAGLGSEYAPQKDILKLSTLETLHLEADQAHNKVKDQENTVKLVVDNRQLVFEDIKTLSTRVISTMSSTNVHPKTIEDAKSINAKIQGIRIIKKEKTAENTAESNAVSVSRQSYDSLYENFKSLVNLLEQDGRYLPEEVELNLTGLTTKLANMLAANTNVVKETNILESNRIVRNKKLFTEETAIIEVAKGVKKYIRGKYGTQSPQFAQIKNLRFPYLLKK